MLSETAAKILSTLAYQPSAQWLVNVLPFGSVYWADEMPDIRQLVHCRKQDRVDILRMFSIRLDLWDGRALSDDDKELWDLVRAQAPTWPLFRRLELTSEIKLARAAAEHQVTQEFDSLSDEK